MSYLNHLAARILGQLPTLQPRLLARFEASQRDSDRGAREPIAYATFTPSTPARYDATPRVDQPVVQSPLAAQRAANPAVESRLEREVHHIVEPRLEREVIQAPISMARETHPPVVDQPSSPPTPDRVVAQPPVVIEQHTQTLIEPPPESGSQPIETQVTREEIREQTRLIEQLTTERSITVSAPREARGVPLAPRVTAYVPPEIERAPAPEAAPIVHVSIGRIEVRAVPAPQTPPPTQTTTPQPALSLADYLHGVRR